MDKKTRSPLKGSILTGSILFIVLLCIVLSVVEYNSSQRMIYNQYETYMGSILNYVAEDIDVDDLEECINTGVASPKYYEVQAALDRAKERLPIHFIYIIIPLNTEDYDNVQNVMAGATQYEYENEVEELEQLNSLTGDSYSPETAGKYLSAYQTGELSYFLSKSEWGIDYTGLLPLIDSKGEKVAALCLDIDIADIYATLRKNVYEVVLLIMLIGALFIIAFYFWTERKVTGPIKSLTASVVEFVAKYRERKDPESLTIDVSSIHTHNEMETLARDVSEMGDTIREYAESIVDTEEELKQITENIYDLAVDLDSLTREYAEESAGIAPTDLDAYDLRQLGEQISELKNKIREYITHTTTLANRMITAMASDYRCVYYVNLDDDDAVCYRNDPTDADQTPAGIHFPYLERLTWYAEHSVTEQYREGFIDFVNPENVRRRLAAEPIIAYRYLAMREGREYYEMIRMAGVRRAEERDDHTVHAVGLGFTVIDEEMRDSMKKNEALAQALAVAEEASSAKTSFLSSMSHEIRTPMNAIIGLDTLALHDETLSPQTREYLEKIGASAHHLLDLINDILDMSRIESGRIVLNKEEFPFSGMLEQINTMVMSQCSEKGLNYECRIIGRVDDYYIGDDTRLKEVLINILSNAIKFTDAPGSVTFTVERIATFEDQSTLRFRIQDTGIGMDKEYIPKIFEAFTQEDGSRSNKYGSTGLGMAITKRIVEMMNGTIEVESEKGVGSVFTVVVTLKNCERCGASVESTIDRARMHVLVVDDEKLAVDHARTILDEAGIRVDTCMSGQEALTMLDVQATKQEPYNLVLVDRDMPGMNGIEAARRIRERYGSEGVVVILTAYHWDDIMEEATRAGVDGFLAKPLFASSVIGEFERIARRNNMSLFREKQRAELTGRRILLAEDMEINAEIMMDVLDMEDIQSEHAENGRIAVEMFEKSAPGYYDAILMDVRMPEMDGLEAASAIRAMDRADAKRIPIIALTANAFDEDVQRSLQAGMNAHLSKPVEPDHLYQTLGELIFEAEAF